MQANKNTTKAGERTQFSGIENQMSDTELLLVALKGLVAEVQLGKLNIRKDFGLINAHAYATKVIHAIAA